MLLLLSYYMNLIIPFFGGMPMCHGAGGLAGQYYFGARTGMAYGFFSGLVVHHIALYIIRRKSQSN